MSTKRSRLIMFIIIVLVLLSGGGFLYWQKPFQSMSSDLTASGTIETTILKISPEISGRISEVNVNEGDTVNNGDILIVLEGSILKAQRNVAASALDSARAEVSTANSALAVAKSQYDIVLENNLSADQKNRKSDWKIDKPIEFDQPGWFFTRDEQLEVVDAQVSEAEAYLQEKIKQMDDTESKVSASIFLNIEKELLESRQAFHIAKRVLDSANGAKNNTELHDAAQVRYDNAKDRLYDAQKAYDDALTSEEAQDVLSARAELRVAQEGYDEALDYVRKMQTGRYSLQLMAAEKMVDQAQSTYDQAQVAEQQAQANLDLLDTEIKQLTLAAPSDGVVLTRSAEPGEVIPAGNSALTIANINDLYITVYVPEDRIGDVRLNQTATVTVDSFPEVTFKAVVVYISDHAEYTPRNVQTVEGRKSTVFAVKLLLEQSNGKLKPGMPADVKFNPSETPTAQP